MTVANGIKRTIAFKKESTWGTAAGASGGKILRRTGTAINLRKATYASAEIRQDQQIIDFRHGVRTVGGSLSDEWSGGTFQAIFEALFRAAASTAATTGALTNVTAAAGPPGTFTRATGSFITDGFKVGDVIRWSGWATGGSTANNARNYRITTLTALIMTVGTAATGAVGQPEAVIAQASGDSVTATLTGKKIAIPSTGHTDDSFTIEDYFSDITVSKVFTGVKFGSCAMGLPATGMATLSFDTMGKDMSVSGSQYFSSPTAETTSGIFAAVNGTLRLGGADVAIVTGAQLNLAGNMQTSAAIGSNTTPLISQGRVMLSGQLMVHFTDSTFLSNFVNEDELALNIVMTASSAVNAEFVNLNIPRIKLGSADVDDGEKGLIQTMSFQALKYIGGATTIDATTMSMQDSLFT